MTDSTHKLTHWIKQALFWLFLSCVTILGVVGAAEIGLRYVRPMYLGSTFVHPGTSWYIMFRPHHEVSEFNWYLYDPGSPKVLWRAHINHASHRGQDYGLPKPEGMHRLLILGDSVTYGMGAQDFETMPALLEHGLRWANDPWEVLNASVPSWHTYNQLHYFKDFGYKFHPDIVAVNVIMNDFKPLTDEEWARSYKKAYESHRKGMASLRIVQFVDYLRSGLSDKGFRWYRYQKQVRPPSYYGIRGKDKWWYIRGEFPTAEAEALYKKTNELCHPRFLKLKRLCESKRSRFLVIIYPTASQTSRRYHTREDTKKAVLDARPIKDLKAFCARHDIPALDLLPIFRAQTMPLFTDECHLTPAGHLAAARATLNKLVELGWTDLIAEPFWESGRIAAQ